ncbi:MAG: riboflavin synthase [Planctomycetes bacterium]|nr:riboflavin synthase [Planctomycetota bacterium]
MFTGIIETTGKVKKLSDFPGGKHVCITVPESFVGQIHKGDSVSINGICLTAAILNDSAITFDAVEETVSRTSLKTWSAGAVVNMERSLRAGDPMGGHIVSGHVDGTGILAKINKLGDGFVLEFSAPENCLDEMIFKGSVAVDGISLTIMRLTEKTFSIAVIPHTWSHTNLHLKREGDMVNIETDVIAKYVKKYIAGMARDAKPASKITPEFLKEYGF